MTDNVDHFEMLKSCFDGSCSVLPADAKDSIRWAVQILEEAYELAGLYDCDRDTWPETLATLKEYISGTAQSNKAKYDSFSTFARKYDCYDGTWNGSLVKLNRLMNGTKTLYCLYNNNGEMIYAYAKKQSAMRLARELKKNPASIGDYRLMQATVISEKEIDLYA